MGVSKVNYGSKTLIDLTGDTVTANKLLSGYKAHNKAGNAITGTCTYDCDSSDATANEYDIYSGKIAYVNGSKVTGKYKSTGYGAEQYSANSSNCSSSKLVIPCNFKPKYVTVTYQPSSYSNGKVICGWFNDDSVTYHSKTSLSPYIIRTQKTSSNATISDYFYYDSTNKQVVINRPSISYSWHTENYKVFCFK